MTFSNLCNEIFWKSTNDYHVTDSVDAQMNNPYELKSIEYYLYLKKLDRCRSVAFRRYHP